MRQVRLWTPVAVVVILLIAFLLFRLTESDVEGVVFAAADLSREHDPDLRYEFGGLPPMGGAHNPNWQNCGIYTEPVAPEFAIHSMEHGAVWITYHPDLPADQVAALQDQARGKSYLLLSPFPDQEIPLVLTAWDVQLRLDSASDERVGQFISRYQRSRGPERASCTGGVGTPLG